MSSNDVRASVVRLLRKLHPVVIAKEGIQGMHNVIIPTGNCQKQQGWHPIAVKKKKKKVVEYLLLCVARTLMSHLL